MDDREPTPIFAQLLQRFPDVDADRFAATEEAGEDDDQPEARADDDAVVH